MKLIFRNPLKSQPSVAKDFPQAYDLAVWQGGDGEAALTELRRTLSLAKFEEILVGFKGEIGEFLIQETKKLSPSSIVSSHDFGDDPSLLIEEELESSFSLGIFCIDPRLNSLIPQQKCDLVVRLPGGYCKDGGQMSQTIQVLKDMEISPEVVLLSGHNDCKCEGAEDISFRKDDCFGQKSWMVQPAKNAWGSASIQIKKLQVPMAKN